MYNFMYLILFFIVIANINKCLQADNNRQHHMVNSHKC